MKFQELNAEVVSLRQSLGVFVSERALEEIVLRPPISDDEASFLRLVAWSYVFVFEAGRLTIPYLVKLSSGQELSEKRAREACELIHDLRTWSFHNLGFTSRHGAKVSRRVQKWFMADGNLSPPNTRIAWRKCFERLCSETHAIVLHCKGAIAVNTTDNEEGEGWFADLRSRLSTNWSNMKFDEVLGDISARLGQTIDVPEFRASRVENWRTFLQDVPPNDNPEGRLLRFIERDLLDYREPILPIDSNDVMLALELAPGQRIADALSLARVMFKEGRTDADSLVRGLQARFQV